MKIKKIRQELRPEYIKKLEKIRRGKFIRYNSIEELREKIEKK